MKSEAEILQGLCLCRNSYNGVDCIGCPYFGAMELGCMNELINDVYLYLKALTGGNKNEYSTTEEGTT